MKWPTKITISGYAVAVKLKKQDASVEASLDTNDQVIEVDPSLSTDGRWMALLHEVFEYSCILHGARFYRNRHDINHRTTFIIDHDDKLDTIMGDVWNALKGGR